MRDFFKRFRRSRCLIYVISCLEEQRFKNSSSEGWRNSKKLDQKVIKMSENRKRVISEGGGGVIPDYMKSGVLNSPLTASRFTKCRFSWCEESRLKLITSIFNNRRFQKEISTKSACFTTTYQSR